MRFLYTSLIYSALALGLATIWSLGHQAQSRAELARAQNAGPHPEFTAAARRAAAATLWEATSCPVFDDPTTRPAPELVSADLPKP